ncbi:MAG: hypothetical protein HKN41_09860, partial [Ilumatobacter sp.]|nr:hypothetical protein [Ilumatobacter sp.]
VIGRDNLFVCDASALARLPERNPFLVVVRLAEAAVARWSPPPSFKVPS